MKIRILCVTFAINALTMQASQTVAPIKQNWWQGLKAYTGLAFATGAVGVCAGYYFYNKYDQELANKERELAQVKDQVYWEHQDFLRKNHDFLAARTWLDAISTSIQNIEGEHDRYVGRWNKHLNRQKEKFESEDERKIRAEIATNRAKQLKNIKALSKNIFREQTLSYFVESFRDKIKFNSCENGDQLEKGGNKALKEFCQNVRKALDEERQDLSKTQGEPRQKQSDVIKDKKNEIEVQLLPFARKRFIAEWSMITCGLTTLGAAYFWLKK